MYSLDANTGNITKNFGNNGRVDLRFNSRIAPSEAIIRNTSPGIVYKNLYIISGANLGIVRAFDIVSGQLAWKFNTLPAPGEDEYKTWPKQALSAVNGTYNWAGMALDEQRSILFVSTSSP